VIENTATPLLLGWALNVPRLPLIDSVLFAVCCELVGKAGHAGRHQAAVLLQVAHERRIARAQVGLHDVGIDVGVGNRAAHLHRLRGAVEVEPARHAAAHDRARTIVEVLDPAGHVTDHDQPGAGVARRRQRGDLIVRRIAGEVAAHEGAPFHFRRRGQVTQHDEVVDLERVDPHGRGRGHGVPWQGQGGQNGSGVVIRERADMIGWFPVAGTPAWRTRASPARATHRNATGNCRSCLVGTGF
jgi:hypothetical protein